MQAEHNTEVTVQTPDVGPLDTGDPSSYVSHLST